MSANLLKKLVEAVRKQHPTISVEYSTDTFSPVVTLDGWVYICADDIEVVERRIGFCGLVRVPGFTVEKAGLILGSHWEPDDADVVPIAEYRSPYDAVRCAYATVLEHGLTQCLNAEAESLTFVEVAA